MSNTTAKYSAGEIGRVGLVEDFLPPPADLVPREGNVKVTLSLSDPLTRLGPRDGLQVVLSPHAGRGVKKCATSA